MFCLSQCGANYNLIVRALYQSQELSHDLVANLHVGFPRTKSCNSLLTNGWTKVKSDLNRLEISIIKH